MLNEQYKEKVIETVRNAGKWLKYYEKEPYLIDVRVSLTNLERLVKEIK